MVALIAQQTGAPPERAALGLDEWQASALANLQDRSRAFTVKQTAFCGPCEGTWTCLVNVESSSEGKGSI